VTTHIIHLTQYIDKTYLVKEICASVLLELNIKLLFGIKHFTQIKRYAIRRQMNVCKHILYFKIQYNFKDSNACVIFLFSWSRKIHNFQGQNIKAKLISNVYAKVTNST